MTHTLEDLARMEALYRFLLERGDKWTSMAQATDSISAYPAYFRTSYHNSTARRMLTADIEYLNEYGPYDKIIVSGKRGIKLANREDLERYLNAEFREIFRKLKRARMIAKRANLDQQYDLDGRVMEIFLDDENPSFLEDDDGR